MMSCSFCGKSEQDKVKLLTGPNVFICNECVFLCVDILEDQLEIINPYKRAYEFLKSHLEWIQRNPYYPWLKEFSIMALSRCQSEILDPDYDPGDSY